MTQTQPGSTSATTADVLDQLVGIQPGSMLAELRACRPDVARYTQGSYDALLAPEDLAGVSLTERIMIALRVAVLTASAPFIAHYRQRLEQLGVPTAKLQFIQTIAASEHFPDNMVLTPREVAMLRHTDLLTNEPRTATQAEIAALQMAGLHARDIVTIAQLIAFLSFQVRVLAGLQLLAEEI